jgi:hypothetical protein
MTPQLLIFLVALIYLGWATVRFLKRRNQKHAPFIEVLEEEEEQQHEEPPQVKKGEGDPDQEWRRRVRAEIEDMTK